MSIAHRYDTNVPHALYLSNFGGAHGHSEYKNAGDLIEDITKALNQYKLLDKEGGYFIYGMTNGIQTNARKLLKVSGFKSTKIGNLEMHSITDKEFATAAALATEAQKKEEARLAREAEKIKKAREERDIKEGRQPGELRVGDVVGYYTHSLEQKRRNPYVIVGIKGTQVSYVSASSFTYYTMERLTGSGNWSSAKDWSRQEPDVEAAVIKRYSTFAAFVKARDA